MPISQHPVDTRPVVAHELPQLISLFVRYYAEECAIELSPPEVAFVNSEIERGLEEGYLHLLLAAAVDSTIRGFIIFQVDTPASDWCLRPGSGFIRELYVLPEERGCGLGGRLVAAAEQEFDRLQVPSIYLTTDDAASFWAAQGYRDSGLTCRRNGGRIFEKDLAGVSG
ncbi:MAG: GNAT family N-acetyltransferase [Bacillota bacterium]|nr:GNAT family N-acetyltransferase [Bacillota bacterium]